MVAFFIIKKGFKLFRMSAKRRHFFSYFAEVDRDGSGLIERPEVECKRINIIYFRDRQNVKGKMSAKCLKCLEKCLECLGPIVRFQ